jgi:hypothetical protein
MPGIILLGCQECEAEIVVRPSEHVGNSHISCPNCKIDTKILLDDSHLRQRKVVACVACGHDALYVQKDFNRTVGMAIVGSGIVLSVLFFYMNQPFYAMAALIGTALADYVLHLLVKEVTVCYACHAIYRGFERNPDHEAFDLKKLEKYGGRTPRF